MSNVPVTFADRVREKINGHIADLIPEEDIKKLVDARVNEFMVRELPALIDSCIRERATEVIKAEFAKPDWQPRWEGCGEYAASKLMSEIIERSAGRILTSMIGMIAQQTIHSIRY